MLGSGRADAFQRLAGGLVVGLTSEVAEADDSNQPLLLVNHRQAAHLRLAHLAGGLLDMLFGLRRDDAGRHQLAHQRVRTVAQRNAAHRNVAVGDDADQALTIGDRDRAGVRLQHETGRIARLLIRTHRFNVGGHDFRDLHGRLLVPLSRSNECWQLGVPATQGTFSVSRS